MLHIRSMDPRLYGCAKSGDVHFLKHLLVENPSILLKLTPRENTALHIAVQFGHINVVAEIYSHCGLLLTWPNSDGDTPLHVAARTGNFSVVEYMVGQMLSARSSMDSENGKKNISDTLEVRNTRGNTVLHEAVSNGHQKVAKFLIKVEPNLACFENDEGESPLFIAAREGMTEMVNRILLSTPSVAHGGSGGSTALHAAVIERHYGNSSLGLNSIELSLYTYQTFVCFFR